MRKSNSRIKVAPRLSSAAVAAGRPLAGISHAASLAWDRSLVIRGAAGATLLVLGHAHPRLRDLPLSALFHRPETLADAIHFGTARTMSLVSGQRVRVEAGPCPGGAVAVIRRATNDELELSALASAIGHELRNAFASVTLAIQSISRSEEVVSERGRRRLELAERELRRIECALRGIQEVGRVQTLRLVEAVPERLVAEALANLGPLERDGVDVTIPEVEGATAQLDAPRVCLAIEEMLRLGARQIALGGKVVVTIERRPNALAIVAILVGPRSEALRALADPARPPDLGMAVIQGVGRAHGGHAELIPTPEGITLALVLPQRPGLS